MTHVQSLVLCSNNSKGFFWGGGWFCQYLLSELKTWVWGVYLISSDVIHNIFVHLCEDVSIPGCESECKHSQSIAVCVPVAETVSRTANNILNGWSWGSRWPPWSTVSVNGWKSSQDGSYRSSSTLTNKAVRTEWRGEAETSHVPTKLGTENEKRHL